MPNYLFDTILVASFRLDAPDAETAEAKLRKLLDCADTNFGAIDGEPICAEVSLDTDQPDCMVLVEVDGEMIDGGGLTRPSKAIMFVREVAALTIDGDIVDGEEYEADGNDEEIDALYGFVHDARKLLNLDDPQGIEQLPEFERANLLRDFPLPAIGTKFKLRRDVDRFDSFIAATGLTGTITNADNDQIEGTMDEPLPGAEAWNNAIIWHQDHGDPAVQFYADVEVIA